MALLDGKVVIVTGGAHGIGKAYCRGIAREGGVAIAADIDEQAAKDAAKAIQNSGADTAAQVTPISQQESARGRKSGLQR